MKLFLALFSKGNFLPNITKLEFLLSLGAIKFSVFNYFVLVRFAAEIFHDLHEEVMATAARGHGLMARVKQLEAEVPSLEKAFFSQTHHSSFYSNGG